MCGILDCLEFWIPHNGIQIPGTGYPESFPVELRYRIPNVIRIPDSLSLILDSKAQNSGFHLHILYCDLYCIVENVS